MAKVLPPLAAALQAMPPPQSQAIVPRPRKPTRQHGRALCCLGVLRVRGVLSTRVYSVRVGSGWPHGYLLATLLALLSMTSIPGGLPPNPQGGLKGAGASALKRIYLLSPTPLQKGLNPCAVAGLVNARGNCFTASQHYPPRRLANQSS